MKATINWHGDRGTGQSPHISKSNISEMIGLTELTTLATALSAYSLCNLGRHSVSDYNAGTPAAPGINVNVDERAIIYFKDPDDDSIHSITIPGWDTTTYPLAENSEGDRIATADVAAVVALINTATGKSYIGTWGKHIKKT